MSPWVAVIGTRALGRHRVVTALRDALEARGLRLGGFTQRPVRGDDGAVVGYDAVSLGTGERVAVARPSATPEMCSWGFLPEGFERARRWADPTAGDALWLELGRLEANRQGHYPTALAALARPGGLVVLSIRPQVLREIGLRLPDPVDGIELPEDDDEIEAFASRVAHRVGAARRPGSRASGATGREEWR